MMDWYIQEHYCDSENIADNVRKFGTRRRVTVKADYLLHEKPLPKKEHDGFNVLYYFPGDPKDREFAEWLYGWDRYVWVKALVSGFNELWGADIRFIEVDGTNDMSEVYPIIDFLLRINRHDGSARMVSECKIQGIPYYWVSKDPKFTEAYDAIIYEYKKVHSSSHQV